MITIKSDEYVPLMLDVDSGISRDPFYSYVKSPNGGDVEIVFDTKTQRIVRIVVIGVGFSSEQNMFDTMAISNIGLISQYRFNWINYEAASRRSQSFGANIRYSLSDNNCEFQMKFGECDIVNRIIHNDQVSLFLDGKSCVIGLSVIDEKLYSIIRSTVRRIAAI